MRGTIVAEDTPWAPGATDAAVSACPVSPVVDLVFSRWTTPILWTLHQHGRMRFV